MMDLMVLEYFATVARLQHMGKAAEELNITQPSLSAAIQRLEREVGYKLFDRTGRGIRLNEYGKIYLQGAEKALGSMRAAVVEMDEYRHRMTGVVRLACSGSDINSRLIDFLMNRGMQLKVSNIPENCVNALMMKRCDLIITLGVFRAPQLDYDELYEYELVFVVGKDHPLASKKQVRLEDFQYYLFCSTDVPHALLNVLKATYKEENFEPTVAFWGRNSEDMLKAIRTGKYIGIMVKEHLPKTDDYRILDVIGRKYKVPMYLYRRMDSLGNYSLQAVRREIIDFYDEREEETAE